MFNAFLRAIPSLPTTVLSVKEDNYHSRAQVARGNGLLLYSPDGVSSGFFSTNKNTYDVILPTESVNETYSLFRTNDETEAVEMFTAFNNVIPQFLVVTKRCTTLILQEACDTIRQHRSWSIAHLLAYQGKYKFFEDPVVQKHIDDIESEKGMTPIMIAIETGNLPTVQALLSLCCSVDKLSLSHCSVIHYAAITSKDILNSLLKKPEACRWVNSFNADGHTPLHLSCLADKPDCVTLLLIAGANANICSLRDSQGSECSRNSQDTPLFVGDIVQESEQKFSRDDMKYGGTPLHWCLSKEVIEALVQASCNINAINLVGQTALHLMVLRNRLDCAVTLLYSGADASIGDADGNTPLHLAIKNNFVDILKALVVFGANVNYLNKSKESPRHLIHDIKSGADKMTYILHVAGANRCVQSMGGCTVMCCNNGDFNGTPDTCVPNPPATSILEQMLTVAGMERAAMEKRPMKGGRLLCLDGGGIRGLILIQVLLELQEYTCTPIIECFDWIAGTSTGGILALALASGKSLKECQMLYFKLKDKAFIGERPYSSEGLEDILKDCVGCDTMMSGLKDPKLMITGVLASQKPLKLCIFRNYPSPTEIINSFESKIAPQLTDELIWEVARSTSAAPSYFKSHKMYVDGGLIANNPTLDALTEILEHGLAMRASGKPEKAAQASIVVSCGTGLVPVSKMQSLDLSWSKSLWETIKMASRLVEIGTLLVDLATCTDGRVVDRARAWCSTAGIPYYRFNPQMSKDVPMDETSNDTIVTILWETKAYMYQNRSMLREVSDLLQRHKSER